jgi:DNA-binding NarL/FixJ family response regulator
VEGVGVTIKILLVDDQELVRTGFRLVLRGRSGLEVVGEAEDGRAALEAVARLDVDVVVMDIRMPGMDGIAATKAIRSASGPKAGPKVLVLTTFDLDEYAYAAIKAGASGFLLKDSRPAQLAEAIRAVHAGDAVVAPSTTRRLLDRYARFLPEACEDRRADLERLTPREREVLVELAGARSNAEIAVRLRLSEATVRTHINRILAKLGLRDRVQAVVFAYETGLVTPVRR